MADKSIDTLPKAPSLYDDSKIPVSQQGTAYHLTGEQIKDFAKNSVSEYIETAKTTSNQVLDRANTVLKNVNTAGETQVANVEAKGEETLKTIPDDYTTIYNDLQGLLALGLYVSDDGYVCQKLKGE
jgi:hypothetical protein